MVNVGVMMKLALSPFPPPMLYLAASNLTGPSLRPDGCIHSANSQQLRKHITLDCNQYRRHGFRVSVCSSDQGLKPGPDAFMIQIRAV